MQSDSVFGNGRSPADEPGNWPEDISSDSGDDPSDASSVGASSDGPEEGPRAAASGPAGGPVEGAVKGEVKWFNPTKGFGFVRVPESDGDAFLHISCLSPHGLSVLHPGAEITCTVSQGPRGLQVQALISVESEGSPQAAGERGGPGGARGRAPSGPTHEMEGTVKFFNARKGFGFVTPDDGGQDVFLPGRVLTRCGIVSVAPNQRLRLQVRQGFRGLAAESVEEI